MANVMRDYSGGGSGSLKPNNKNTTMTTYEFKDNNESLNLLGNLTRVEVPFIKVIIGDKNSGYTFGVYDKTQATESEGREVYRVNNIKFPNYIKSLEVTKINGQVNKYTLQMFLQITPESDPNFLEKVFSSVSQSRKIYFSYGDMSMPTFIYRDEEAIITNITTSFAANNASIDYTISAISSATLLQATNIPYIPARKAQPSTVIYELLRNTDWGLQEIFYGMKNLSLVEQNNLIARDDKIVSINAQTNTTVLEYLNYLVSCMTPVSDSRSSTNKSGLYVLTVIDDVSGVFQGPYFTVRKVNAANSFSDNGLGTYVIDMGYPSQNIVLDFNVVNNETYSIYYDYANKLTQEQYTWRINDNGKMEPVYAPLLSSGNSNYKTSEADRSWWTAVTSYPISAEITLKGLLRPSLLMSHLKLNMYYFGKKHLSSGTYLITQQVDTIDRTGFRTKLSLVRESGDDDYMLSNDLNNKSSNNGKGNNINGRNYVILDTSVKGN